MTAVVSRETEARLKAYEALLHKWQKTINLVAPSTLPQSWNRHFEDSVQILPLLGSGPKTLYDLGSGAGFPGLVIVICRPDISLHLMESDQRKCEFLRTVSRETGAPVTIHAERIEALSGQLNAPDFITARALKSLPQILDFCAPWLAQNPNLKMLLHKGKTARAEEQEARAGWNFDAHYTQSKTDPEAFILSLSNIRKL